MIAKPQFIGCFYVASAAIGGLGVEGGLTSAAIGIVPTLPEDAGVALRILANGAKKLISKGINFAASACGVSGVIN